MDIDPPKRWKLFKAELVFRMPQESRKKIKRLLRLGDEYMNSGEEELAEHCYHLSRRLAEEARAVHLLKKIEQRTR
ncbi:MAG TPA: hypothetical protein GX393_09440 [Firmicutes bacterium]|jgi:hypothetical protein|nr:hypothetical protein [Bacillota bacterium]